MCHGNLLIVEFLADREADLTVKNKDGKIALFSRVQFVNTASLLAGKMASALRKQGKFDDVGKFYKELLEHQKKIFGIDHPETLTTQKKIEMLYDQCFR